MADITAAMVKDLRERTGLGMMDCKKALVEAEGDAELAIENLRKSSGMKAAKKAGRTAADGLIGHKIEGGVAAMVEVNCETDFAGRDSNFLGFVETVTNAVFDGKQTDVEALLASGIEAVRETLVQKIGEKMVEGRIRKFLAEISLVEQAFVKDPDTKVGALLKKAGASVVEFVRYEVGEGIEVEEVDFAAEVAQQLS